MAVCESEGAVTFHCSNGCRGLRPQQVLLGREVGVGRGGGRESSPGVLQGRQQLLGGVRVFHSRLRPEEEHSRLRGEGRPIWGRSSERLSRHLLHMAATTRQTHAQVATGPQLMPIVQHRVKTSTNALAVLKS